MEKLDTLGKRLKYSREQKGIKQNYAAKTIGVAPSTLAGYESDFRDPDTESLQKMAALYKVSVDWLLGRVKDPETSLSDGETELFDSIFLDDAEIQKRFNFVIDGRPATEDEINGMIAYIRTLRNTKK